MSNTAVQLASSVRTAFHLFQRGPKAGRAA